MEQDRYSEIISQTPARFFARGLLYSLTTVVGLILAFSQLDLGNFTAFRVIVIVLFGVFGVEVWTSWRLRQLVHQQTKLQFGDVQPRMAELINHVLIPLNVFIWTLSFGYYNSQNLLRLATLITMFFILMLLFTNSRSYYQNRQELWLQTNFSYDLGKFYIFFAYTNSIINFFGGNVVPAPLLLGLGAFTLLFLTILRYKRVELMGLLNSVIASLSITILLYIVVFLVPINVLSLTLLSVILYYLAAAFVHHQMERDLSRAIILEYLAVGGIAMIIAIALG